MKDMRGSHRFFREARQKAGLTQHELAQRAGMSQPAIAKLERGATNPTLATLSRCAEAAGFELRMELVPRAAPDAVVERYKRDVDRTLLRENLRKSVDERLRSLADWQTAGQELQRAVREARARS
jgi:transcriptional regulator with XRE-family HTH domain